METLVQLIFLIALAKFCLKAALSGSLWRIVGYAAAAATVALAIYPVVIEQPLTIVTQMLADKTAVANMALITTAEAIAGIFISIYLLDNYFKPKTKRSKSAFILKITPGVVVFGAIAYFELLFFKLRAGDDFLVTASLYAALLFAAILTIGLIAKYAIGSESLKLEVKVILNMAILVVGLLISSSVADYNISHAQATIEWGALGTLIVGAAALIAIGIWFQKINILKQKQQQWNK